jgi:small conductance mechanosensitive channel
MPDLQNLGNYFVLYGINFAGAIVVAIMGWWISRVAERITQRALLISSHLDETVASFLSNMVRYTILVVTLVVVLQLIGIQATSLVAVVGAASLSIGLALQGTLSNMSAGVMLLVFRPFRLGDKIEVAGRTGTVKALGLFITELANNDNMQVLIPNGQVWGAPLTNFTAYSRIEGDKHPDKTDERPVNNAPAPALSPAPAPQKTKPAKGRPSA